MEMDKAPRKGAKPRLGREAWEDAALAAIARGGLASVAVEPLAVALGTTKGSFYWHFADREALITAALERWERRETVDVIARVGRIPDAGASLGQVFTEGFRGELGGSIDAALLADAGHPAVARALRRVTRRRLSFTTALFARVGFPVAEAQRRATLAYAAYLGHVVLRRADSAALPRGAAADGYLAHVLATLLTPLPTRSR